MSSLTKTHPPDSKKTPLTLYNEAIAEEKVWPDPAQRSVVERFDALARTIDHPFWLQRLLPRARANGQCGIYLWSGVGRGKTMMMDLFFRALSEKKKERIHFNRFMADVHVALFAERHQGGEGDPLPRVAKKIAGRCRILCFDEFQVSDIADAMILSRLFTALFDEGVTVVFTSNRAPEDLYLNGLQRESFLPFIELLKERLQVVEIVSKKDYRTEKIVALDNVYFMPLGREADLFLDHAWQLVCHGEGGGASHVLHQGRAIEIRRCCGDVAFFRFRDLCLAPLSAGDYLALCARFRTFIVEGIPRMTREHRDAAKRFVTLIDILYDAHARLICTAEAPPEALYPAGDGNFEFARTVSRLAEMRSEDYLRASQQPPTAIN